MIVSVADLNVPTECPYLGLQVAKRQDLLGGPVRLQPVAVNDCPEVPYVLMGRRGEGLPVLAFLKLAVAGHHDHAAASADELLRPCHSASFREAHPERARVRLDA